MTILPISTRNTMNSNDDSQCEKEYHKGVKRLYENGIEKVPTKYLLPVQDRPNLHSSKKESTNINLPIIDLSQLHGPNRNQVIHQLADACKRYGFFQVVNHGVPEDVIADMKDVSKRFFELPFEEREKYMSTDVKAAVRYGTSFNQNNDGVFCWRDFLKVICKADDVSHWPSLPEDLRKHGAVYSKETRKLFLLLVEMILESLGVRDIHDNNEDDILEEFKDGSQLMVVNCYPPCPEPDLTLGMPPHSDYGFLTLLLQDEVQGLQIQFEDKWVTVEPIANAFVVNIGDHLEIFSNGRYKSVLHRVVVNPKKTRVTIASLHSLPFDNVIRPSEKLIDKDNPRRYKDTDYAAFMEYLSSHQLTKKSFLDSRKIS